ncbi:hypothetical protein [Aquabacterium sp.]|uniref:hypothetical protein n=1 Tax=Aquabacterium sp. TaxID=1872578 RepID=UPI0035B05919
MAASGVTFKRFLDSRRKDLRRIAAQTCGECMIDDVCSEAWLVADEISRKRGFAVDFLNTDDQEQLLSWLYVRLVRYADKSVRYAVKLDRDWDSEDADSAAGALARLLTAPEQFDPLKRLIEEENRFDPMALIQYSYSQASAYVILLHRFDWDLANLADHLRVVVATLRTKVCASGAWMANQPSLFDRINTVELDFSPRLAKRYAPGKNVESSQAQLAWCTPDWTPAIEA